VTHRSNRCDREGREIPPTPPRQRPAASLTRFTGVTITDALVAGALSKFGTTAQRAVSAAKAGMDLLLVCGEDPSYAQSAVTGLANALRGGQLSQSTFDAARTRVTNLRASLA
jgi:beta-N-acetylhexosaminidase